MAPFPYWRSIWERAVSTARHLLGEDGVDGGSGDRFDLRHRWILLSRVRRHYNRRTHVSSAARRRRRKTHGAAGNRLYHVGR